MPAAAPYYLMTKVPIDRAKPEGVSINTWPISAPAFVKPLFVNHIAGIERVMVCGLVLVTTVR